MLTVIHIMIQYLQGSFVMIEIKNHELRKSHTG